MIKDRMLHNRFVIISLLLSLCFSVGCPPPNVSLLVKDDDDPIKVKALVYDNDYYRVNETYTIEQLNKRLSDVELSQIRLIISDYRKITGDVVEIRDDIAYVYSDDHIKHEIQMMQINRFILYKEIPTLERTEMFLTPVLFCTVLGTVRALNTKESSDVLAGALIGIGLGMPTLFNKHRETEKILNLYNENLLELKRY